LCTILILITSGFTLNSFYAEAQSSSEFLLFKDPEHGFNVKYPESWTVTEHDDPYVNVMFISPDETAYDEFAENVLVMTEVLVIQMSLGKYIEINIAQSKTPNFELIESTSTTIAGNPAQKIVVYDKDADGFEYKQELVISVKDDMGYLIGLTATPETYSTYSSIFNEMVKSFEIYEIAPFQQQTTTQIPDWIRNNAQWWAQGAIGDSDFVSGIQFLIKEGIMQISETAQGTTGDDSKEIPAWIKNNADWWAQGLISDDDFVKGIQYLVEQGIIRV